MLLLWLVLFVYLRSLFAAAVFAAVAVVALAIAAASALRLLLLLHLRLQLARLPLFWLKSAAVAFCVPAANRASIVARSKSTIAACCVAIAAFVVALLWQPLIAKSFSTTSPTLCKSCCCIGCGLCRCFSS